VLTTLSHFVIKVELPVLNGDTGAAVQWHQPVPCGLVSAVASGGLSFNQMVDNDGRRS
jgi:hypothetical protein